MIVLYVVSDIPILLIASFLVVCLGFVIYNLSILFNSNGIYEYVKSFDE